MTSTSEDNKKYPSGEMELEEPSEVAAASSSVAESATSSVAAARPSRSSVAGADPDEVMAKAKARSSQRSSMRRERITRRTPFSPSSLTSPGGGHKTSPSGSSSRTSTPGSGAAVRPSRTLSADTQQKVRESAILEAGLLHKEDLVEEQTREDGDATRTQDQEPQSAITDHSGDVKVRPDPSYSTSVPGAVSVHQEDYLKELSADFSLKDMPKSTKSGMDASSYHNSKQYNEDTSMPTEVVAELAVDTDALESERDELKRQLSLARKSFPVPDRHSEAPVIMATIAEPKDMEDNSSNKFSRWVKLLCVGVILAVALGVTLAFVLGGSSDSDGDNELPEPEPEPEEEEEQFFPRIDEVDGTTSRGEFGSSLSLNFDGTKLVVADNDSVHVYASKQGETEWTSLGDITPPDCIQGDVDKEALAIRANILVDISRNGKFIAVGCPFAPAFVNGETLLFAGKVELYQDTGDDGWARAGLPIYGTEAMTYFGSSVSLSDGGGHVAVGSPGEAGGASIWAINQGEWIQFGDKLLSSDLRLSVNTVSMNANADIVAVGGVASIGGGAVVRVFGLVLGEWVEMGEGGIAGNLEDTAYICELSGNGKVVAVSNYYIGLAGPGSPGALNDALDVRAFEWNEQTEEWDIMGTNLHASAPGEKSGYFITMSDDGRTMGMGDPGRRSTAGTITGHAHIYHYENDNWIQLGPNEYGDEGAGDQFGYAVSLSGDGRTLASGAPLSRANGFEHGRVITYDIDFSLIE